MNMYECTLCNWSGYEKECYHYRPEQFVHELPWFLRLLIRMFVGRPSIRLWCPRCGSDVEAEKN